MRRLAALYKLPLVGWLLRQRFLKFGMVGASGVVVNLGVLYLAQEHLFAAVHPVEMRLNLSLALAILFSTLNNFVWNRKWTWGDRKHHHFDKHVFVQFGQYALACWLGIVLQVAFTKILVAAHFYYLLANLMAIVLASVFNYLANDFWTFGRIKRIADAALHPHEEEQKDRRDDHEVR